MSHRIFLALPISDRLQEEIFNWEKRLPKMPIHYLKGKNIHMTILPPWHVDDLSGLGETLKQEASKYSRFSIKFDNISFGPNIYQPRLIWATGKASVDIVGLRDGLAEAFDQNKESKPFKLHTTLARFQPADFSTLPINKLDEKVDWREEINSIVIMETHLSEEGADYEIIAKALLK